MFKFYFLIEQQKICFNLNANGDTDCNPFYLIYRKQNELISVAVKTCCCFSADHFGLYNASHCLYLGAPAVPFPCFPNSLLSPRSLVCSMLRYRFQLFCQLRSNTRSKMVFWPIGKNRMIQGNICYIQHLL